MSWVGFFDIVWMDGWMDGFSFVCLVWLVEFFLVGLGMGTYLRGGEKGR